ncbi:MAG TPA: winged helix-turn-helix transcriptional regulator [bacterium]|nr:winged helix-turn-helix transcriptional regulator [bacterium]
MSNKISTWTFLTNHSHVLLCLVESPSIKMREIAEKVGITERAVQNIIADLRKEGYIDREKKGRRNKYKINTEMHLKHPLEEHKTMADLIRLIYNNQ